MSHLHGLEYSVAALSDKSTTTTQATHMHRAFLLEEILSNIFGHLSYLECHPFGSLAVLARTCRTFKEPALDILWEELRDLSPLARCLPEACCASGKCYSFSRELHESEWDTLRSYTHRVRYICSLSTACSLDTSATRVIFTQAPSTDPLFPQLRSLSWRDLSILPIVHVIVPSLTSLTLYFTTFPEAEAPLVGFLDAVGKRCQYMENFCTRWSPALQFDAAVSSQVCRWTNLRSLDCFRVTLSTDAILHLASVPTLTSLSFTLSIGLSNRISQSGSILVFPNLSSLRITSAHLKSVIRLFSYVRLPRITDLYVSFSDDAWKQDLQAYWAAVGQACLSSPIRRLTLKCDCSGIQEPDLEEQMCLHLTLDDLPFYKTFHGLEGISVSLPWSVKLTDADLFDLVYESPGLIDLAINVEWGWGLSGGGGGGITLDGLLQLLRHCPSLANISMAIDTKTFTDIPQGLDVAFSPSTKVNFLDSYISRALVPRLASVFAALKLDPWGFCGTVNEIQNHGQVWHAGSLWNSVRYAMLGPD